MAHKTGLCPVGETSVVIAVSSTHRQDALQVKFADLCCKLSKVESICLLSAESVMYVSIACMSLHLLPQAVSTRV